MAKIDTSTIAGFEAMSAEEKLNAVLGIEVNDGSAEIERLKGLVSKANSEAAAWKKKHNDQLSEEEQKQNQVTETIDSLQKELEELRKEKTVSTYTAKLLENGFNAEEAGKAASALADGKMDVFWSHLANYKSNLEKTIRSGLLAQNRDPGGSGGSDVTMTKEKYNSLSMTEKMKFMQEHRDEYESMISKK